MSDRTCIEIDCSDPVYSNDRCVKHRSRWYYAANAERIRERRKAAREGTQRDRILAEKARYREARREELAAKSRDRYQADPEHAGAAGRTPRARAAHAERKRQNRSRYTEIEQERRVRKLALPVDDGISTAALAERDGSGCTYCGVGLIFARAAQGTYEPTKATIDHITPISRGGAHVWANVCLACWRCNLSKGNKLLSEWTRRPVPS